MEEPTNKTLLDAFTSLVAHVDTRFDTLDARLEGMEGRMDGLEGRLDGMEGRMSGMEARMESLTKEMRTRFDDADKRLADIEDDVKGIARAVDTITVGDETGTDHITLSRTEYDKLMESAHMPNRFAQS
jgi:hypothetical protein